MEAKRERNSWSEIIRWLMGVCLYYTRSLDLFRKIRRPKVIILSYHRVIDDYVRPQMAVSPATFEKQMNFLRNNFKVASLDEAMPFLKGEIPLKEDIVVITFDDGYRDNYTQAFPILRRYSLPATIFLTTNFIGTDRRLWWDEVDSLLEQKNGQVRRGIYPVEVEKCLLEIEAKEGKEREEAKNKLISILKGMVESVRTEIISHLKVGREDTAASSNRVMLSWEEVDEMKREGISFGAHTHSHLSLTELPLEAARKEIVESKTAIEIRLKEPVGHFSYPFGEIEDGIKKIVWENNFQSACSIKEGGNNYGSGQNDLFALKRIGVNELSSKSPFGSFSDPRFALRIFKGSR
ncbi:MAG: polysaccharide deacetylase family protein [bacterium]